VKPAAPPTASPASLAPAAKPAAAKPAAPKPADKKPAAVAKAAPPRAKEPATFVGSLVVVSRPTGATVSLDGRVVGTTPLTLPEVAAGSHAVKLELDGYRTWSVAAEVVSGQQKRVSASLERRERRPEG
jgi:hypothetical protein